MPDNRPDPKTSLIQSLCTLFEKNAVRRMVLSKPQDKTVTRGELRPTSIKGENVLQITRQMKDGKALHQNIPVSESESCIEMMLADFKQWNLFTEAGEAQVLVNSKGGVKVTGNLAKLAAENKEAKAVSHDRSKRRILPDGPVDFLIRLGITDKNGRVLDKKQDKYRQINRFLEYLEDLAPHYPKDRPVKVVDFGCGKSYLTFAIHYYFSQVKGMQTDIIGLDLKEDVIELCNQIAADLNLEGIRFLVGDINRFAPIENADLTVSLHACDTATDAALAQAIASNSKTIVSVPCCHHELANQIDCAPLGEITRHGILKHRLADIATDTLRASYLEAAGYQVQVFEFIEAEHTPKNLMLRAVRKNPKGNREAYQKYCALRDFLSVSPSIEKMANLPFEK